MSTEKPDILHLRVTGSAKQPLKAIAAYHRRSQANAVEWLITEEYRRLVKAGELRELETAP